MRKRELVKITIENQAIMQRIQQKKSAYNIRYWEKNREENEKLISNICEYPPSITKPRISTTFYTRRNEVRTEVRKIICDCIILASIEKKGK